MPFYSIISTKLLVSILPLPLLSSILLFYKNKMFLVSWSLISWNSTNLSMTVILDPWGCLFSAIVLFISSNVMYFASVYMAGDPYNQRFTHLVLLFVASMNLLIYIPNLICLLLGWDGLGIVSFVLVIYYQNPKSLAAGMITALMNRVGDVMILLSIAMLMNLGNWSITSMWNDPILPWISALLMVAAMTKSAQIPFSSWLPAAMAAPTPVSALVHSSTLVTAGVFLIFRFHYSLSIIPFFNTTLLIIASITMFMAGTAAIAECDMKKIIALSTLSQLGVMMTALGLGLTTLAFFHLITHALFKALLFLTAGSLINFHHHSQDLRFMGNLSHSSPLSMSSLLIANLALCGSPFLAGFYSKDLILEMSLFNPTNSIIMILFLAATALTASYSIRFMISVVWNSSNSLPFQYISDSQSKMTSPMIMLTMGAIAGGASLHWLSFNFTEEPFLPLYLKTLPLLLTILGAYLAYQVSSMLSSYYLSSSITHLFFGSTWFLQPTMSQGIINYPLSISSNFLKILDGGWLEILGSQGIFSLFNTSSTNLLSLSSNQMTVHLSLFTLGCFLLSL
uniref:NADH-ubiquinone oxidoreductase chain 5 n=1 Tax=Drieschia cf. elegans BG-2021 TaxID=2839741 RepID=A0A8E7MIN3_9ANNE|nr:NADH dehydrogenase subunit 5 [Drieschia cf. elegans BG-2021]